MEQFYLNQNLKHVKTPKESPKENCRGDIQKDIQKVVFQMSSFEHTDIEYFWDSNYEVRYLLFKYILLTQKEKSLST